jgi:hypothetical protein
MTKLAVLLIDCPESVLSRAVKWHLDYRIQNSDL